MFSVIVTLEDGAWDGGGRKRARLDRFGEYSDKMWAAVRQGAADRLSRLNGVDALLLYETEIPGPRGDVVRVGHTNDVRLAGCDVTFEFVETATVHRDVVEEMQHELHLETRELSRTHWTIKDADLPGRLLRGASPTLPQYDVVLSYAAENREYVAGVKRALTAAGVKTFYDRDAEADLWGKDLAEHFTAIYGGQGRFCVMFVSRAYVEKMWTRHERRSALAHAMESSREYVLPVRFDDAQVPGLRATIAFLDGREKSPDDVAQIILQKLGRHWDRGPAAL